MDTQTRMLNERKDKVKLMLSKGVDPYPHGFAKDSTAAEIKKVFKSLTHEQKTTMRESVSLAGRVVSSRTMGKASFANLLDQSGTMQLYVKQDNLGKDAYDLWKALDLGDWVGVEGVVFRTKTGELTVEVKSFKLLCKSLRPLPEKYHGLKDPELRYRKRYLDMIANPEVKRVFEFRSKAIREIRAYLSEKGYLEVETPILQPQYGGAAAKPFVTKHNALDMDLYLKISPELYLKRLLVGGFEKVFDLSKNFRNEGIDFDHNPEFTMLEWYEAYADYHKMMDMSEELIKRIANSVFGKLKFSYRGMDIDLSGEWERLPMYEAISKHAGIDCKKLSDDELFELASKHGYALPEKTRGFLVNHIFEELVQDKLVSPVFIIDYPVEISPLTKRHRSDPDVVERAELYIAKSEFANMYSELNDPQEQRARLEEQERQRAQDIEHNYPMDEDFCQALEHGMPPAGGIGIGIDRLLALLCEVQSIREVILFPTLRPDA